MIMQWARQGLIYKAEGKHGWDQSHAQVPTPFLMDENTLRIFYAARDSSNRSQISYIDVDPVNPRRILYVHGHPVLEPGRMGTFDDCGVMPSWVTQNNGKIFLYYIGWNVRNTVPYYNSVGLAISEDGSQFRRYSDGPLWDRDYREPYFSASTCVLYHEGRWKVWYLSCTGYFEVNGLVEPRYHIKYAESPNGIDWDRKQVVAIDYRDEHEAGLVKASVVIDQDCFRMWYSTRNFENYRTDRENSYRIGYAESGDGIHWKRLDEQANIELAGEGWDSQMMAYPHVADVYGKRYLFYNGNGFGKTGFGFAVSESGFS